MILRDFLFLDTDRLSNYLSVLEGYVEEEIEETETEKKQIDGKLSVHFAETGGLSEQTKETKRKFSVTIAGQFQKLYELLDDQDSLKYLDLFDMGFWEKLERGEVVEIQANIRIPTILLQLQQTQNIAPYIDLMRMIGQDPLADPKTSEAMTGMTALNETIEDKPVPIIFTAISTPGYQFFTELPRKYLQSTLEELQGEAMVLGKIHRFVGKGKKEKVFSITPELDSFIGMSRKQRRAMKSSKKSDDLTESIRGPAIILTAIAVYR